MFNYWLDWKKSIMKLYLYNRYTSEKSISLIQLNKIMPVRPQHFLLCLATIKSYEGCLLLLFKDALREEQKPNVTREVQTQKTKEIKAAKSLGRDYSVSGKKKNIYIQEQAFKIHTQGSHELWCHANFKIKTLTFNWLLLKDNTKEIVT